MHSQSKKNEERNEKRMRNEREIRDSKIIDVGITHI